MSIQRKRALPLGVKSLTEDALLRVVDVRVEDALAYCGQRRRLLKTTEGFVKRKHFRDFIIEDFKIQWISPKKKASKTCIQVGDISRLLSGTDADSAFVKRNKSREVQELSLELHTRQRPLRLTCSSTEEWKFFMVAIASLMDQVERQAKEAKCAISGFLKQQWALADVDGTGRLSEQEVFTLMGRMNISASRRWCQRLFKTFDQDNSGMLEYEEFIELINFLLMPPLFSDLFDSFMDEESGLMTDAKFKEFLRVVQKCPSEALEAEMNVMLRMGPPFREPGGLTKLGFCTLLSSVDNSLMRPDCRGVVQDMTRPLNEYWISSTHNTSYVTGQHSRMTSGRLHGDGVSMYRDALLRGSRCIELEIWDGPAGVPVVVNAFSLSDPLELAEVLRACKEWGWRKSPYPIILCIEARCQKAQRAKLGEILREILGDTIWGPRQERENGGTKSRLPSPEEARGKFILKAKWIPPGEEEERPEGHEAETQAVAEEIFLECSLVKVMKELADGGMTEQTGTGGTVSLAEGAGSEEETEAASILFKNSLCVRGGGGGEGEDLDGAGKSEGKEKEKGKSPSGRQRDGEAAGWPSGHFPSGNEGREGERRESGSLGGDWGGAGSGSSLGGKRGRERRGSAEEGQRGSATSLALEEEAEEELNRRGKDKERRRENRVKTKDREKKEKDTKVPPALRSFYDLILLRGKALDLTALSGRSARDICSLNEGRLMRLSRQRLIDLQQHNRKFMARVYPAGSRVLSSNFNPTIAWLCGCQIVSLNHQVITLASILSEGRFLENGGSACGYVLKPPLLREAGGQKVMDFFKEETAVAERACTPATVTVEVCSATQLPKPSLQHRGDLIDPYVVVRVDGAPQDSQKFETVPCADNGFNPEWKDQAFRFDISVPSVALLSFEVRDSDRVRTSFVAAASFPVSTIRPGIRSVQLFDDSFRPVPWAALHIRVGIQQYKAQEQQRDSAGASGGAGTGARDSADRGRQRDGRRGRLGRRRRE